jgi:antirestriction protein ArdC
VRFDHINDVECKGYFSRETREIVLQEGMTELQNVSVLIHELAHSLLHADEKARNQAKNDKEIQAESVSYLVCKSLGLDTSCWSFGYVGGWAKSLELEELRAAEELIKATAAKIKDAIIRPEAKAA